VESWSVASTEVGKNMWDHDLFPVTHEINMPTTSFLELAVQANVLSPSHNLKKTGIPTANNAEYFSWKKVSQNYYANLGANAKADLAAFPTN
jgi:hypothetical protein